MVGQLALTGAEKNATAPAKQERRPVGVDLERGGRQYAEAARAAPRLSPLRPTVASGRGKSARAQVTPLSSCPRPWAVRLASSDEGGMALAASRASRRERPGAYRGPR